MGRISLVQAPNFFNKLEKKILKNVENGVKETIKTIGNGLITATPIRTGQASTNWRFSVNDPILNFYRSTALSGILFKQSNPTATAGKAKSEAKQLFDKDITAWFDIKRPSFISNAAPYINRLNHGYSPQAQALFVEKEVFLGLKKLTKIRFLK